jgi:diacylglycerol kinase (ATP)
VRVIVLHNPEAGDEEENRDGLDAIFAEAGHDVRYQSLEEDWKAALRAPADLLVVAGGDGTVGEVFKELAGSRVTATVLPVGSANNIARSLGLAEAEDVAELVRAWPNAIRRPYDLGRVEAMSGESVFVETMGGGIFGEVLRRAERGSEGEVDGDEKVELGLRLLSRVIREAPSFRWRLELDGDPVRVELLAVEAMVIGETGPNIPLAPEADPGDGLLDVVLVRPEHRDGLAEYVEARLDGRSPEPPQLEVRRAREVTMRFPDGCPLRLDDELWPEDAGSAPDSALVSVGDLRLEVLVPS